MESAGNSNSTLDSESQQREETITHAVPNNVYSVFVLQIKYFYSCLLALITQLSTCSLDSKTFLVRATSVMKTIKYLIFLAAISFKKSYPVMVLLCQLMNAYQLIRYLFQRSKYHNIFLSLLNITVVRSHQFELQHRQRQSDASDGTLLSGSMNNVSPDRASDSGTGHSSQSPSPSIVSREESPEVQQSHPPTRPVSPPVLQSESSWTTYAFAALIALKLIHRMLTGPATAQHTHAATPAPDINPFAGSSSDADRYPDPPQPPRVGRGCVLPPSRPGTCPLCR